MHSKKTKKADETRQKIFETAMHLMSEKGYQGATIRDICNCAGVSVGSFYRYFPAKSDILKEVYDAGDTLMENEDPELLSKCWLVRIEAFIAKYAKLNNDTGLATMRILYNPENKWFTLVRPMQHKLEELIFGAQSHAELTPSLSAKELTEILFVCMRGICYDWCISNGSYNLVERMTHQMSLLLSAFKYK